MSDFRVVNARLRQVVADKDERIAALEALVGVLREQLATQDRLISGQAQQLSNQDEMLRVRSEQIDMQGEQIAVQAELIKQLWVEVVELRRRMGTDSTNPSVSRSSEARSDLETLS